MTQTAEAMQHDPFLEQRIPKVAMPNSNQTIVPVSLSPVVMDAARNQLNNDFKKPKEKKAKRVKYGVSDCWVEVSEMSMACRDLLRTSLAITPLLRERDLVKLVEVPALLSRTISAITRDTFALAKELNITDNYVEVRKTQCNNEGAAMSAAQTAFQHYVNFMERFDSGPFPLIEHASEQLTVALIAYKKVNPIRGFELETQMNKILERIGYIVRDSIGITQAAAN